MLEVPEEIQEEIRNNMIFKQVPINERVIRFEVQYSQEKIDQLYNKLELCNQYIFNQLNK